MSVRKFTQDVLERRTLTGSGLFELFGRDFEQILWQIVSTGVKTLSIQILQRHVILNGINAHFRLTYVAQKRRYLNSLMACLRTSDATYDNCSIDIWKTHETALKTPQNRRKKGTKNCLCSKISVPVTCLQYEEVKKNARTVTETQQFYQGWWLEILFVARVYWTKIQNTFSCPGSGAYSCQ